MSGCKARATMYWRIVAITEHDEDPREFDADLYPEPFFDNLTLTYWENGEKKQLFNVKAMSKSNFTVDSDESHCNNCK
jgi:hypothetical protein